MRHAHAEAAALRPAQAAFTMPAPPIGWVRSLTGRAPRETVWQQALRWSTLTLSAGIVAGEVLLWLAG
jgi:hypothetical protein